jgi:streptogramin lyase
MSQVNAEDRLQGLREQALRREVPPDAWPRLQRRLRRERWRRAALVAGAVALAVVVASVVPGLLARRTEQPPVPTVDTPVAPVPTVDTPVVPGRPVVAARIRLGRPLVDVDVGYGAVWVTGRGALTRIDPRSNRVVATIATPLADQFASIAFGEGAVWVTSGQSGGVVYRVDPAVNRVTAAIPVPGGAFGIVVAAGTVWVTQRDPVEPVPGPGVVVRIDARTHRLLPSVEVPSMPLTIRYGLDAIWVTSSGSPPPGQTPGGVSRIDPRTGAVTRPLGSIDNVLAVGGGALWGTFAYSGENSGVLRVDPGTGRVVATFTIPYGVLMAFGLGTLWVAQDASTAMSGGDEPDSTRPGRLYRIDPTGKRVLGRPVPLPGTAPTALAAGEGAVWVGELDQQTLTRFNLVP